jgi:protein tyrosine/serine phosphatase
MAQIITRRAMLGGVLFGALAPSLVFARDATWALPLTLDGVPNLNQVAPNFYRSAQPTAEGFKAAEKALHLKAVVDLRSLHSDTDLIKGTNIQFYSVPMNAWHITSDEVITALKLIKAAQSKGAVLVHCRHGADRTGVVVAMYRMVYQGWSKEQALDEMEHGGFNFHAIFANIPNFVMNADIEVYKAALK